MKKTFYHLAMLLIATLYLTPAIAQAPLRVEIEAKKNSDAYHIVAVGKNGILLFYETDEKAKDGGKIWVFTKYNTDFKEVWSKEEPVKSSMDYVDNVSKNDKDVYLLLGHKQGQGLTKGNYEVISVNMDNGLLTTTNSKIPNSSIMDHFDVVNGNAYLSGISIPSTGTQMASSCLWIFPIPCVPYLVFAPMIFVAHPQVYELDLSNGTSTVLSKKMKGMGFIVGTGGADGEGSENVIIRNEPDKKTNQVICNTYTNGDQTGSVEVKGAPDKIINRANLLKLNKSEGILIGTYSNANVKKGFFKNLGPGRISNGYNAISNGMFFTKIKNDQTEYTKYYDFSKFTSFYKYLEQRYGSQKVEKKAKNIHQLNYLLLIHDILEKDNQYVMVAEAYYPEYETYTVYVADSKGGHYETRSVFVGWRYTHAIVAGFDKQGEKLWDNTFEIQNILTFDLKERVKVLVDGNTTLLAYSYGGRIETKVIEGNNVVQGKFSTPIETNYKGDKVLGDYSSDMSYWYDKYFVTYGYQRIKNTDDSSKKGGNKNRKRTVFYFNKIAFQ